MGWVRLFAATEVGLHENAYLHFGGTWVTRPMPTASNGMLTLALFFTVTKGSTIKSCEWRLPCSLLCEPELGPDLLLSIPLFLLVEMPLGAHLGLWLRRQPRHLLHQFHSRAGGALETILVLQSSFLREATETQRQGAWGRGYPADWPHGSPPRGQCRLAGPHHRNRGPEWERGVLLSPWPCLGPFPLLALWSLSPFPALEIFFFLEHLGSY